MKIFKNILLLALSSLLGLGVVELGSRGVCATKWGERSCRFDLPGSSEMNHYWVQRYDPHFGAWHDPHTNAREIKSCFDVTYSTNSYGARDQERKKISDSHKERWVVLGDSWVEGYGLPLGKTLPALLEQKTGLEHLNFGIGGNSPLQYLLRYRYLAKDFDHDGVMVAILPFNDFEDMDPEVGKILHSDKNRPYLVGQYPDFQIEPFYITERLVSDPPSSLWKRFTDQIYFLRFYNLLQSVWRAKFVTTKGKSADGINSLFSKNSSYYSFSEQDWFRLRWVLERFLEETRGKKLVILSFPTPSDLLALSEKGGPTPLSERMKKFFEEHQDPNVVFIDMLPLMHDIRPDSDSFFFTCDSHMNPYGSEMAASLIYQKLKDKFYTSKR